MKVDFDKSIVGTQSPEVQASTLPIISEAKLAGISDEAPIIKFKGRFWRPPQGTLGLLHVPLSTMAKIKPDEFGYPTPRSLGVVARVDGEPSNAVMRVHILSDLPNFEPTRMKAAARRNIKSAVSNGVRIERVTPKDIELLANQDGYDAWLSSAASNGRSTSPDSFERHIAKLVQEDTLVLAARVNGKIAGYLAGECIREEGTAYLRRMVLSRDGALLASNAGSLLTYSFVQACMRTPGVEKIVHSRERNSSLTAYKIKMGFPLEEIPLVVKLKPTFALVVEAARKIKPELYYKIYGRS